MNRFINSLIARSAGTEPVISPRLPGRFETAAGSAGMLNENNGSLEINAESGTDVHQPIGSLNPFTPEAMGVSTPSKINFSGDEKIQISNTVHHIHEHRESVKKEEEINSPPYAENISENARKKNEHPALMTKTDQIINDKIFPKEAVSQKKNSSKEVQPLSTIQPLQTLTPHRSERNLSAPGPAPSAAPHIKISIGRIEVHAISVPAALKTNRSADPVPKTTSLEEYLKNRDQGS